ncbi:unnamed protein product [Rotaria sp. Silwood2]|nr:unnamed protein product [Rotaria sp. Silwood2]CAF4506906.1 unnamed protein product [Rotaria sp. Silwood2]CAF4521833.1 unnamed protein product [Rotaria sp. Silwood2]
MRVHALVDFPPSNEYPRSDQQLLIGAGNAVALVLTELDQHDDLIDFFNEIVKFIKDYIDEHNQHNCLDALKFSITCYKAVGNICGHLARIETVKGNMLGYVQQQRFAETKRKYYEAISVFEKTLPYDHRYIDESLQNMSELYFYYL